MFSTDAPTASEQGWHHFSVPRYAGRPRLFCWCGHSVEMTFTGTRARPSAALLRFLSLHAACAPDEAWLLTHLPAKESS